MEQKKYAQHFLKLELIKFNIDVFQNESGNNQSDFIIKTEKGIYHEVYLRFLNLEKESSIKILKEDLDPKKNLWIALVLIMKNMDCSLYLIPSFLLLKPKEYTFFDKDEPNQYYWKINVLLETIPELSMFSIENIIDKL